MKVRIKGDTPMERLTNLTKRVLAVDKTDVEKLDKAWQRSRSARRKRKKG